MSSRFSLRSPRGRRFWLGGAALSAVAVLARPGRAVPEQDTPAPDARAADDVTIEEFAADGRSLGMKRVPKIVKTEAEWRAQLTPEQFYIARQSGTERAFTGATWNLHKPGLFRCVCCEAALFNAATKFDSGTGWPSFWQPVAPENVALSPDTSLFMQRTAVSCRRCDAHLGHVFNDGPPPTGLRFCMNSASLRFVPLAAS